MIFNNHQEGLLKNYFFMKLFCVYRIKRLRGKSLPSAVKSRWWFKSSYVKPFELISLLQHGVRNLQAFAL